MAEGMRSRSGATVAIATTGLAGPDGGSADLPVGTVWTAAATASGTIARRVRIKGTRERVQRRAAAEALYTAWLALNDKS
jgi:PncC family amidohydrolase